MKHSLTLFLALTATAAAAQVPPATIGQPYIPAPWWMKDPVIASMGHVRTEVPANRAAFAARFSVVGKTAADATTAATAKARELDAALAALGKDKLRLTTTLVTRITALVPERPEAGLGRKTHPDVRRDAGPGRESAPRDREGVHRRQARAAGARAAPRDR